MISVLLIILKIIGITLLVIIGLFLFLLLLVLFVPVRYRFKGSYDEKFLCKGKITWLLHLISIKIDVEERVVTSIRILGIPLSVFMKKKDNVKKKKADKGEEESAGMVVTTAGSDSKTAEENGRNMLPVSVEQTGSSEMTIAAGHEEKESAEDVAEEEKQTLFDKLLYKIQVIIQKVRELAGKVKSIFEKIKDTVINIKKKKETVKRYLVILRSDTAKAAFALCRKRIFRMLKHMFPRRMRVNITYGMEDPADTGYILAVFGMLPGFVGKRIVLHADFNQPVFKGDFNVKGGIRAVVLLYQGLCVILDKNCQRLYHIVKKEISNEHK